MLLLIHIFIALSSIAFATFLVVSPTQKRLVTNNILIGATLGTGFLLIFQDAKLLTLCTSGLTYTLIAVLLTVVARYRLAKLA